LSNPPIDGAVLVSRLSTNRQGERNMINHSIRFFVTLIGASALLAVTASAFAGNSSEEAAAAASHAGYAAKATDIKQVHMHLHHVVNCLVGPKGEGFDTNEANPCAAMGNGAIPDTNDPITKDKLRNAVEMAQKGLATDDMMEAKKQASATEMALKPSM